MSENPCLNPSTPGCRRLARRQRLRRSALFDEAKMQGRRRAGRWMVMCLRQGPGASLRLGVIASRRIGGAVVRNRAKRRLREVFRRCRNQLSGAVDVILVARNGVDRAGFREIEAEFLCLAARFGLLKNDDESPKIV